MNEHKIKMKLATSLSLLDTIEKILYPNEPYKEKLPFKLQYRLVRTYEQLKSDYDKYASSCIYYKAFYGKPNNDNTDVILDEIGKANYNKKIEEVLTQGIVEHRLFTVEPDDLDVIDRNDLGIDNYAMRTFVKVMTNDPELEEELNQKIEVKEIEKK